MLFTPQTGADNISPAEVSGLLREILAALPANATVVESVARSLETVVKTGGDAALKVVLSNKLVHLVSRTHESARRTAIVEEANAAGAQSSSSTSYDSAKHQSALKVAAILKGTLKAVSGFAVTAMPTLLSGGTLVAPGCLYWARSHVCLVVMFVVLVEHHALSPSHVSATRVVPLWLSWSC